MTSNINDNIMKKINIHLHEDLGEVIVGENEKYYFGTNNDRYYREKLEGYDSNGISFLGWKVYKVFSKVDGHQVGNVAVNEEGIPMFEWGPTAWDAESFDLKLMLIKRDYLESQSIVELAKKVAGISEDEEPEYGSDFKRKRGSRRKE